MKRTFLADSNHDCGEELEVVVEREDWMEDGEEYELFRLVSWPSQCKCGRPIPLWEPTQNDLMAAYELPEAEDV